MLIKLCQRLYSEFSGICNLGQSVDNLQIKSQNMVTD